MSEGAAPPHIIASVPVQIIEWPNRGLGAFAKFIAFQVSVAGLYLPPEPTPPVELTPPQTIISLPVQTAVAESRGLGALTVLTGAQVFVAGLYLAPVFDEPPPQTIISLPVHSAE